jgi:hypothetical protein
VTEDLRARLLADLGNEHPPPVGDLVAVALREGRRLRRKRQKGAFGAGIVLAGVFAGAAVLVRDDGVAARGEAAAVAAVPAARPPAPTTPADATTARKAPTGSPGPRTLTVLSGTQRADVKPTKATPAAMLRLLTVLMPTGRTSHFAVAADDDLRVQLYLDAGAGPAMVRLAVDKVPGGGERGDTATVTVTPAGGDCLDDTVVRAGWPDGTRVTLDLASCLPEIPRLPTPLALTVDQAVAVAADPRWGLSMDAALVAAGDRAYGTLPEFAG